MQGSLRRAGCSLRGPLLAPSGSVEQRHLKGGPRLPSPLRSLQLPWGHPTASHTQRARTGGWRQGAGMREEGDSVCCGDHRAAGEPWGLSERPRPSAPVPASLQPGPDSHTRRRPDTGSRPHVQEAEAPSGPPHRAAWGPTAVPSGGAGGQGDTGPHRLRNTLAAEINYSHCSDFFKVSEFHRNVMCKTTAVGSGPPPAAGRRSGSLCPSPSQ